jgi:protein-disulfide isomerase
VWVNPDGSCPKGHAAADVSNTYETDPAPQGPVAAAVPADAAPADAASPTGPDDVSPLADEGRDVLDLTMAPAPSSPLEPVHASVAVAGAPADLDPGAIDEGTVASEDPGSGAAVRRGLGYVAAAIAGGALVLVVLAAGGQIGGGGAASASPSPGSSASASSVPSASSGPSSSSGPASSSVASGAIAAAAPVLGDPAAPILVEIWADYQCPYCGALSHVVEPALQRDYVGTGRIRLAYRDFAFLGTESVEAAAAAVCAGRQDAYWHYHDLLFASQQGENQGAFSAANLVSLAGYAGLDTQAFVKCMADPAIRTAIAAETAQGRAVGIESTPTLRLIGPKGTKLVKGLTTLAVIDAAIAEVTTGIAPSPTPGASGSSPASSDAPASTQSPASPSTAPSVTSPAP